MTRYSLNILLAVFAIVLLALAHFGILDNYVQIVVMTIRHQYHHVNQPQPG